MSNVYQIRRALSDRGGKPRLDEIDLAELATIADALSAGGRGDLAAHVVEILYFCGERRVRSDSVVPFSAGPLRGRYGRVSP